MFELTERRCSKYVSKCSIMLRVYVARFVRVFKVFGSVKKNPLLFEYSNNAQTLLSSWCSHSIGLPENNFSPTECSNCTFAISIRFLSLHVLITCCDNIDENASLPGVEASFSIVLVIHISDINFGNYLNGWVRWRWHGRVCSDLDEPA